jgi:hypothetical protein
MREFYLTAELCFCNKFLGSDLYRVGQKSCVIGLSDKVVYFEVRLLLSPKRGC